LDRRVKEEYEECRLDRYTRTSIGSTRQELKNNCRWDDTLYEKDVDRIDEFNREDTKIKRRLTKCRSVIEAQECSDKYECQC